MTGAMVLAVMAGTPSGREHVQHSYRTPEI